MSQYVNTFRLEEYFYCTIYLSKPNCNKLLTFFSNCEKWRFEIEYYCRYNFFQFIQKYQKITIVSLLMNNY
jgi:hypothetical protein